ncbi:taurine transport system substrate-binding protein [Halanaerobium saccharolyticum]|uniref:Taurine transport system substrate-binding protein n=1 Tax=Halanaerobium saccharolyticum TaxID=43595 RepID=A0A4R7YJQ6_9FIRM|nr:MetQ/NlpA family ABC transporter substrate-binding protein [Halanaerobium saccharolyticum]RAK04029.1 taurine transport system substrate-binding protein [Halanaerobium saccharolyticum]TDV97592.1 taurine transport system substrate-binding protein [Halanaerobium saccharolyticum]TDX49177.1 taurine transport system substrate-binding protein [Halanaerobium saccharolyticum]
MKKSSLKKILLIFLISALALTLTACGNDQAQNENTVSQESLPEEINFGILRVPNDETIAIAEGFFDEYFTNRGIEVNTRVFDSGVEANQALASGSIDFATMGNTNAITALARDLNVELIWIHEVLGENEALAIKDGSGIEEVTDLVGERIAVPFASTAHYILLNVLKEAEIEEDVQLLDMQTAEIVAAWERGDIQAAYTWQPTLAQLLKSGSTLTDSKKMADKGYITANVEVVRSDFAEEYPQLVADFISTLSEAGDIYRNNPERAAEIAGNELGLEAEVALHQMRGTTWKTREELLNEDFFGTVDDPGNFAQVMKDTSDFLQAQDSIEESPSQETFNEYVNPEYIKMSLENDQNN